MMHTVDLVDEFHPTIAELKLTLLLLAPIESIAIDIITGFPSLMSQERQAINNYLITNMHRYQQKIDINEMRPLIYADKLVEEVEQLIQNYFSQHDNLILMSANVAIQTDIIQTNPIIISKKQN